MESHHPIKDLQSSSFFFRCRLSQNNLSLKMKTSHRCVCREPKSPRFAASKISGINNCAFRSYDISRSLNNFAVSQILPKIDLLLVQVRLG